MRNLIAALTASLDPASLVAKIAEQACVFMPEASGATVSLCADDCLTVVSAHGAAEPLLGNVISAHGTLMAHTLETKAPQCSGDATVDPHLSSQLQSLAADLGVRSWLTVPLYRQERPLGVLTVMASVADAFSSFDVARMVSMGRFVSALIGSHLEMSEFVTELLEEEPAPENAPAARFLASFLIPHVAHVDHVADRVHELLDDSTNFEAVFQPVIDLHSGQILGFEGLSRFPNAGDMSTEKWFREARRVGCGMALELAAMRSILDSAQNIPDKFDIGVNLSPLAALNPEVQEVLMSVDRQIVLELTEHEQFPEDLNTRLGPLRACGVLIAVDDAGAGFASFTQTLRVRPDIIKIDGEIIRGINNNSVKRALATGIVQFAAEIGALAVAESIENAGEKRVVQSLGIPRGQGYFLGRPRRVGEIPLSALR